MGIGRSLLHLYSYGQYLSWYIQKGDIKGVLQILSKKPQLAHNTITLQSKMTALYKAVYMGKLPIVKLLVQKYQTNVNQQTQLGQTPLIAAIKRNKLEIIEYLLEKGANPNFISKQLLSVIQYAILPGYYQIAQLLYGIIADKQFRSIIQYHLLAKQYQYRYVNYSIFLEQLVKKIPVEFTKDFLKRQRKLYTDPVIDPRQTWKQWFIRTAYFKDPPLVERFQLPEQWQPHYRKYNQIKTFMSRLTMSPFGQLPNYIPETRSQNPQHNKHQQTDKPLDTNTQV